MKKVRHSGLEVRVMVAGNKQEIITEEGEGGVGEPSSEDFVSVRHNNGKVQKGKGPS